MREEIPLASRILRIFQAVQEARAEGMSANTDVLGLLRRGRATLFDPHILVVAEEYLNVIEHPGWAEGKRQVSVTQLEEGMVIAADLQTSSGIKLLPAESTLTRSMIERIQARHKIDPIINWVYVYRPAGPVPTQKGA